MDMIYAVFGESDEIYVTTLLGLDRGNQFKGSRVLILGGGDGGLLHTLTTLPDPPEHVIMAEVSPIYFMRTSSASHFVPLQASTAGLLACFAPPGFILRSCSQPLCLLYMGFVLCE